MNELVGFLSVCIIVAAVVIYTVVQTDKNTTASKEDFNVACLDGVEYWYRQNGYKGYMAVRIDPQTLTARTCN